MIPAALPCLRCPACAAEPTKDATNAPPTLHSWQALAKLPDFGGVWTPLISDQVAQERTNPPPWNARAAKQIEHMYAEEKAGRPSRSSITAFPTGMPSYMLITHNAFGAADHAGQGDVARRGRGNRLRRIYTSTAGRTLTTPIPAFYAIRGHWEGQTLVVDY